MIFVFLLCLVIHERLLQNRQEEAQTVLVSVARTSFERIEQEIDLIVIDRTREEVDLPRAYDYRQEGRAVPVRDQGRYGTCWAFAALTSLETALMPDELLDFSRDHLNFQNNYLLDVEEGGSYIMSVAYMTGWQGPVFEEDDPYGDQMSPEGLLPVKHIQEVRMPGDKDYQAIKQTVYLHGGVESSVYMDFSNSMESSDYYNRKHFSYCYNGTEESNHDVVIIGWDDDYPAENFKVPVQGDGAFICQNSWGESFGEDGIFYVSYYDVNIGGYNVAYTGVEDADNYQVLYQSDLCGWSGQIGYNTDTACFANVYEASGDQELRAVGFYATGEDTEYYLAVIPEFKDKSSLRDLKYIQGGYLQYPGYYTVDLEIPAEVSRGEKFAVAVKIMTPGCMYPIAAEFASPDLGDFVNLDDGEGYISSQGTHWERAEETQNSNLCLKVYADRKENTEKEEARK